MTMYFYRRVSIVERVSCLFLLSLLLSNTINNGSSVQSFTIQTPPRQHQQSGHCRHKQSNFYLYSSNNNNNDDETEACYQSLVDFHEGVWSGRLVASWTVSPDTAAGIQQRCHYGRRPNNNTTASSYYETTVQFHRRLGTLKESVSRLIVSSSSGSNETEETFFSQDLWEAQIDVDVVDASYSLHRTLPRMPLYWLGTTTHTTTTTTTTTGPVFVLEHCIATADHRRVKCFVVYSKDSRESNALQRIVLCEEERKQRPNRFTATGMMDDDSLLVSTGSSVRIKANSTRISSSTEDAPEIDLAALLSTSNSGSSASINLLEQQLQPKKDTTQLAPHKVSLMELCSGVWLGDAIIRDLPHVPESPIQRKQSKGFGQPQTLPSSSTNSPTSTNRKFFVQWTEGVQKAAWRLLWNFGDDIRQINDVGKSMGAPLATPLTQDLSGTVCVNEGLSRRVPVRMVYIDWNDENVGFVVGSHTIQVPRYLQFDSTRRIKPFFTDFATYQSAPTRGSDENTDEQDISLPEVVCSKIGRVYNYQGKLKQGYSSFFTLKRFGDEAT